MRKLVVTEFVSLDGVIENPMWTFPYWNDDIANFKAEETNAAEMLLLGRITYEGFAASWPNRTAAEGGEFFNNVRKYVVTNTLDNLEWNNSHPLKGDFIAEINQLKAQDGGNIVVYGSGKLVQALVQNNLVDEYRLLVYPVVLGTGQRLFAEGTTATLELIETKPLGSVTALRYMPAPK
jgi:dihydrofolate reductase